MTAPPRRLPPRQRPRPFPSFSGRRATRSRTVLSPALNRPGGNVTGITTLGNELGQKRLQMLRELLPAGVAVVLLVNPLNANAAAEMREIQAAAQCLGVRLLILNASSPNEIRRGLREHCQAGYQRTSDRPPTLSSSRNATKSSHSRLVRRFRRSIQIAFSTKPAA